MVISCFTDWSTKHKSATVPVCKRLCHAVSSVPMVFLNARGVAATWVDCQFREKALREAMRFISTIFCGGAGLQLLGAEFKVGCFKLRLFDTEPMLRLNEAKSNNEAVRECAHGIDSLIEVLA